MSLHHRNSGHRVLMIDNYDSFTFNIVQYFGELGAQVTTVRNDAISCEQIQAMAPSHIVVSPGPCSPKEAGVSVDVIRTFAGKIPILGVCLGHQAIGYAFGGDVIRAKRVMHGKTDRVASQQVGIFAGLPSSFEVARYHSLVVKRETLPKVLEVTAYSSDGEIMGLRHREHAVEGVQFHPESVASEHGHALFQNFLQR
jgi:anthranilate synthase component II